MVEAASGLACVLVECEGGRKNQELSNRYGVSSSPTVIFCDPEGRPLERLGTADPASIAAQIRRNVARVSGKEIPPASAPPPRDYSPQALEASKAAGRPLLILFYDDSPASKATLEALADPILKPHWISFLVAKASFRKGDTLCARLKVDKAPTILVLDGSLEKPEENPIARIAGSRTAPEILQELNLVKATPTGTVSGEPRPIVTKEDEALSDDEVDRQFIQAQVTIAQEHLRSGDKAKAVEVLKDILKSYPKHKASIEARRILDALPR